MGSLLTQYKGGFRYDFKISEVLKSENESKINRVFTIYFKSKDLMEGFFGNSDYKKIKEEYFKSSVGDVTIISEYDFTD
jgi:uncharacterized protein (DUF1330 family)